MSKNLIRCFLAGVLCSNLMTGCAPEVGRKHSRGHVPPAPHQYKPIALSELTPIPVPEIIPIPIPDTLDPYTALMRKFMQGKPLPNPAFKLYDPGTPSPVNYEKYGEFHGVGTEDYRYEITDMEGLKKAVGEGIHPNEDGIVDDPAYSVLNTLGQMDVSYWSALKQTNKQAAFMLWAQAGEEPGVKAFFTAVALERAGLIVPAIKAYHAVVVHFPWSASWGESGTFVWYVAPASVSSIKRLCSTYPSLGLEYVDGEVRIYNGKDTDLDNDVVMVKPGYFIRKPMQERWGELSDPYRMNVVKQRGTGTVQVVKLSNGQWQMRVDGQPFVIRGASYGPTEIGLGPRSGDDWARQWMFSDKNSNGLIDAAYDVWVDQNGNGKQDEDEAAVGDFKLLQEMGCNAIRFFVPTTSDNQYDPGLLNKDLFRDLHDRFGISVIAGDFLGSYTVGSGASWAKGTDYTDPDQCARMKELVRQKVMDLKDEPWVLMWLLGNENNMGPDKRGLNATRTNASQHPEAYARFLNEVIEMIHALDPNHPVAIGNLGSGMIEVYNQFAPAIDILGMNAYMGEKGFGGLWSEAKGKFDRPILITEYGCDAYAEGKGSDEAAQADYHEGCLRDIVLHQAGGWVEGNSIGGIIFQYVDEWWKAGDSPRTHCTKSSWGAPFPDNAAHEEWFGVVGQGSGENSPFERHLRQAYFMYKKYWADGYFVY